MVMYFNNEIARKQLLDCREVVTYRASRRKRIGNDIAVHGSRRDWNKIGDIHIEEIGICGFKPDSRFKVDGLNIKPDLSKWVHLSGFGYVDEWYDAIVKLDKRRREPINGYLYHVRLR